jgi:hypothetical protein
VINAINVWKLYDEGSVASVAGALQAPQFQDARHRYVALSQVETSRSRALANRL